MPDGGVRGDMAEDDGDDDDDGGAIAADGGSDCTMSNEKADQAISDIDLVEVVPRSEDGGKAALDAFVQQCVVCPPCVLVPLVSVAGRHSRKPLAGRRPTLTQVRHQL